MSELLASRSIASAWDRQEQDERPEPCGTATDAILQGLRQAGLFGRLPDCTLRRIAGHSELVRLPRGALLFARGDPADALFVLVEGQIALLSDDEKRKFAVVEVLDAGGCLMTSALFSDTPCLVSGEIASDALVIRVAADGLHDLMAHDTQLALTMVEILCRQNGWLVRQIEDLKLRSAAQRLGRYLLQLDQQQGGTGTIVLPIDKKMVAGRLGATPEHLSRAFGTLRSCGVVTAGATIHLRDRDVLASYSRAASDIA